MRSGIEGKIMKSTIGILFDEYRKHKRFVVGYVIACMVLSFVLGAGMLNVPRLGHGNSISAENMLNEAGEVSGEVSAAFDSGVYEAGGAVLDVSAAEALPTEGVSAQDTLLNLNDAILGNRLNQLAGDYSGTVSVSAEPFTALLFLSIVANINKLVENPLNLPSLPLDSPWILIVIAVFFVASKFMRANSTTQVFGVCTLGYLERFLGTACIIVIGILSVVGIATYGGEAVAEAANEALLDSGDMSVSIIGGADGPTTVFLAGSLLKGIISSIFSGFMGFMSLIVNYIIRTVAKGIDAIEVIFSPFPLVCMFCEAGKAGLVWIVCALNVFYPVAGYIVNVIVFIICCVVFRACYYAGQYLQNIYFLPLMRKIFRLRDRVKLVPKRISKRMRRAFEREGIEPDFVIPLYIRRRHRNSSLRMRPLRRIWLVHSEKGTVLYFRKYQKQKDVFRSFDKNGEGEIFLKKGFTLYEIYSYIQTEKNLAKKRPTKDFSLVFAKDYKAYIDDIVRMTGYTDIVEEKISLREEKRQIREEIKRLRQERHMERKHI